MREAEKGMSGEAGQNSLYLKEMVAFKLVKCYLKEHQACPDTPNEYQVK